MRQYELVLVLNSNLKEDQRKKVLDTIKGWIKDFKITLDTAWGQKTLAYPIRHEKIGFYQLYNIESENGVPADFEKRILAQENVLRHLLVRRK